MTDPLGRDVLTEIDCPLCGDRDWTMHKYLYLPKALINPAPGIGLHVRTYTCDTCGYVLLMKLPKDT